MKVESLRPYQKKVNVTVKVLKVNEAREVTSKLDDSKHTVTEALVGDDTATVLLTLWDDDIKKVGLEKTYDIINGFTSLFKKSLRLNVGRYGEIKDAATAITEVNEEKGLSEEEEVKPKEEAKEAEESGESDSESDDGSDGEEF
jgi:replication factor A1